MTIRVLGSGCKACKKLYETTVAAAKESRPDAAVLYVTDMVEIAKTGILSMPALEVDGVVKSSGKVLKKSEVVRLIGG